MKSLEMPVPLSLKIPFINLNDDKVVFSFDGRIIFYDFNQEIQKIAFPDCIFTAKIINHETKQHLFYVNQKNKLECSLLDSDKNMVDKYCINKNVLIFSTDGDKIFYLFNKSTKYYLNIVFYDGKKFIGKRVMENIEKPNALFTSGNEIFLTYPEKVILLNENLVLNLSCDFVYKHEDSIVIGRPNDRYTFLLYKSYTLIDSISIPFNEKGNIRAMGEFILQTVQNRLHILKISENNLVVLNVSSFPINIFDFDFIKNGSKIIVYFLSDQDFEDQFEIYENGFPIETQDYFVKENEDSEKSKFKKELYTSNDMINQNNVEPMNDDLEETDRFVNEEVNSQDLLDNVVSLKTEDSNEILENLSLPTKKSKNKLLEEVKATLFKKKQVIQNSSHNSVQINSSERIQIESLSQKDLESQANIDLLYDPESFRWNFNNDETSQNNFLHETREVEVLETIDFGPNGIQDTIVTTTTTRTKQDEKKTPQKSKNLNTKDKKESGKALSSPTKGSLNQKEMTQDEILKDENFKLEFCSKKNLKNDTFSIGVENPSYDSMASKLESLSLKSGDESLKVIRKMLDEQHSKLLETHSQLLNLIKSKEEKSLNIESIVTNLIVKNLVPCVEACFNEMRIQVLQEIKKIIPKGLERFGDNTQIEIQSCISSGNVQKAIGVFLNSTSTSLNDYVPLFDNCTFENVESKCLCEFIIKLFEIFKSTSQENILHLVSAGLVDLEVLELDVDSLQSLLICLRNIKSLSWIDKEKYHELNFIVEISIKRITKRIKNTV